MSRKRWRDGKTTAERGYGKPWREAREAFLARFPLCVYCARQGRTESATVVDHIKPHNGDATLFWDERNWQPLCKHCHDSIKQREEKSGCKLPVFGIDGYPINDETEGRVKSSERPAP